MRRFRRDTAPARSGQYGLFWTGGSSGLGEPIDQNDQRSGTVPLAGTPSIRRHPPAAAYRQAVCSSFCELLTHEGEQPNEHEATEQEQATNAQKEGAEGTIETDAECVQYLSNYGDARED